MAKTMKKSEPAATPLEPFGDGKPPQRTANGQFAKGNVGGPGNPHARRTAQLRKAFTAAVTPERLQELGDSLMGRAIAGDVAAAKLVLAYTLGRPLDAVDPDRLDENEWDVARGKAIPELDALESALMQRPVELLRAISGLVPTVSGVFRRALGEDGAKRVEELLAERQSADGSGGIGDK